MKIGNQVSVFALALALSAAVPALAQDATDTTTAPDPALTDPAATDPAMTDPAMAPAPEAPAGSAVTVVDVEGGAAAPKGTLAEEEFSEMTAADLIGKSVVNAEGESIGDIDDVVFDNDQKAIFAVISVGGFLGIGSKSVAIPFDQLQIGEDEATLMSSITEDELSEMAEYAEGEYDPLARDQQLGSYGDADADADVAEELPAESPDLAATTDADLAPAEGEMQTDTAAADAEMDMAPAEGETTAAVDADADLGVQTEDGQLQAGADIEADVAVDAQEPAAGTTGEESAVARESIFGDMTAGELIGKDVVNTAGEDIGEVTDLVITDDKAVHAVISVGGFLGIGDKDVAVPLDDLQFGEDEAVLMSGLTKESLEEMPDYENDSWPALEGDQPIYSQ